MANSTAINSVKITTDTDFAPGATLTAVVDPPYAEVEFTWARLIEKTPGSGYKTVNGEQTFITQILEGETSNTYVVQFQDAWHAIAVAVKGINSFTGVVNRFVEIKKPNLLSNGVLALPYGTVVPANYDPSNYNIDVDSSSNIRLYGLFKDATGAIQQVEISDGNWFYDSTNETRFFKIGSDGYPYSGTITCQQSSSPWTLPSEFPASYLGKYLGGVFNGLDEYVPFTIPRSMREFETKQVTSANRLRITANIALYYKAVVETSSDTGHVGDLFANLYPIEYSYPAIDPSNLNFQWQIYNTQTSQWENDPNNPTSTRYISPVTGTLYQCVVTCADGYFFKGTLTASKYSGDADTITRIAIYNTAETGSPETNSGIWVQNDRISLLAKAIISETDPSNPVYYSADRLNIQWQSSTGSQYTNISGATTETLSHYDYNRSNFDNKPFLQCVITTVDGTQTDTSIELDVSWDLAEISNKQGMVESIPWGQFVWAYGRPSRSGAFTALSDSRYYTTTFPFYVDLYEGAASATGAPTVYDNKNYYVTPKSQVNKYMAVRSETISPYNPEFFSNLQVIESPKFLITQRNIADCTASFKTTAVALGDVVTIDSVTDEINGIDAQLGEQTEIINLVMGTDFDVIWYRKLANGDELIRVGSTSNSLTYQITAADIGNKIVAKLNGINAYRGSLQIETGVVASESQNVKLGDAVINGTTTQQNGSTIERLYYAENSYGDYVKDDTTLACLTIRDEEGNVVYSLNSNSGVQDNVINEGKFLFQWYRTLLESNVADKSGLEIKGATNASYRITKEDVGKYIGVKITGVAPDFSGEVFVYFQPKVEVRTVLNQIVFDMDTIIKATREKQMKFLMKKWDADNPNGTKEDRAEYEKSLKEKSNIEIRVLYANAKHKKDEAKKTKVPAQKAPQGMFPV